MPHIEWKYTMDWNNIISELTEMTILLQAIYRFKAIPIKIPMAFSTKLEQINSKICVVTSMTMKSQNNIGKEEQRWRYLTTVQSYGHQNSIVVAQKQTHTSGNRRQPWNKPTHLSSTSLWQRRQGCIQWRKDRHFNKSCWENWIATYKRMELEHSLTWY